MMRKRHICLMLSLILASALTCLILTASFTSSSAAPATDEKALQSFAAIHPIDVHVHVFKTDPAFQSLLERLNLKVMDILVMDDTNASRKQLQQQVDDAFALVRSSHGHVALCTTFDPYRFNSPAFAPDAVKQLDHDFAQGAVAVKIWKNIGMEIKNTDGSYVLADDPKFAPIYQDIARHDKTLMSHQGEPDVAWGPPDPSDPSWSYYQENPQWYVANKPGFPSKQAILDARDRILEQNPKLRMVGVHLGSMEKSLDNIARHLDKYPNFAIDTAARMEYLMLAPPERVRSFLLKYQDRVLYGTDLDVNPDAKMSDALEEWQSRYARDWKYLATDAAFKVEGREVHGLNLPPEVLKKIFRSNALRWIPGL